MNDSTEHDNRPLRRRDRPGDLGRRASIITWLAIGLGLAGLFLVRQVQRQPLPTITSMLVVGAVGLLVLLLGLWFIRTDMAVQPKKRAGFVLTALLFAIMGAFAAYALAYWWTERHGQSVEIFYQLAAKQSNHLDWQPVNGDGPPIRLIKPEPLFMQFGLGSQYPFPLIRAPLGFWVLDNDPDDDTAIN